MVRILRNLTSAKQCTHYARNGNSDSGKIGMKKLYKLISVCCLLTVWSFTPLVASAHPAQDLVKKITDDLILALENPKSKSDPAFVRQTLDRDVLPHIDFNVMTIKSVGKKNWIAANAEQRESLVSEFRAFLLNAYGKTLSEYSGQKMDFLPFAKGKSDKLAVVKTILKDTDANLTIPIDYKLRFKGSWLIYDIAVHSSSLVLGYRSEFGSEIKKGGIDGLINALREKNNAS